jgi:hypothetical protein
MLPEERDTAACTRSFPVALLPHLNFPFEVMNSRNQTGSGVPADRVIQVISLNRGLASLFGEAGG